MATEKQNKFGVKVGDIFHSEWGYNMINHTFYKVIALKGTTQVVVRRLKTINTRDDGYGQVGYLKMVDELDDNIHFCDKITKNVKFCNWRNKNIIKITDYQTACLLTPEEYDKEYYFNYMD